MIRKGLQIIGYPTANTSMVIHFNFKEWNFHSIYDFGYKFIYHRN